MAAMNFNTSNQTLRQLLGNGLIYSVPRFQRDYSWTDEEWDDLWRDIEGILDPKGEPAHYMGYLVLQSSDNKSFDVIDGQQRLATLSILVLAVLANLRRLIHDKVDADRNQQRETQLRSSFIGYLDPVTLIPRSKLNLNRNNDPYYQNFLVPLHKLPQRGLKATEHLMRKAFEWFNEKVSSRFGNNRDGTELARLIDSLTDKLFFTVITVTDELNAFKVFETLNARGVRLSSTDLLKNYLFSVVHGDGQDERELRALEHRWEAIVGKLGGENFPDFLRIHWNSRKSFLRHSELFKKMRDYIHTKQDVFRLVREMEEDADVFAALPNPEDALWPDEQRPFIRELRLFNVRQPYPLLMAARRVLDPAGFAQVLRACSISSFRYNVIGGLATNEQERVYNTVAEKISNQKLNSTQQIIHELRSIYPSDGQFRSAFAEKQLRTTQKRNARVARYILFRLERQLSGRDYDVDSDIYDVEHVFPENPEDGWAEFPDDQAERYLYRIGNFTLLKCGENRNLGNRPYSLKRPIYAASEFAITRKIAEENEEWDPERVANRQRWMANQATSIWQISQLSTP
jgi:hypothetical protein